MEKYKNTISYITEKTKISSETYTNRGSATLSEYNAFNNISEEAKEFAEQDSLKTISYMVSHKAFLQWAKFLSVFLLLGYAAFFFVPIMSWVFVFIGLLPLFFEKIAHWRFIDFAFEQQLSNSFYVSRKPQNKATKRIVFSANIDAPTELTLNKYGGYVWFITILVFCVLGIIFVLISSLVAMIITKSAISTINFANHNILTTVHFIGMIFVPFFIALAFTYNEKSITPGASASLSSCYLSISVLKYLKENNVNLNDTEVGVLINGSTYAGLRGAKAWLKQNPNFAKDIPTYIIHHSNLYNISDLSIVNKDLFGLYKVDNKSSKLYEQAAANNSKVIQKKRLNLSATDTYVYNRHNLDAVSVMALNRIWPKEYNTSFDTYEKIDTECLLRCFVLSLNAISILDDQTISS